MIGMRWAVPFVALAFASACSSASAPAEESGSAATPLTCDVTLPTACPEPRVGYADVAPIFEQRCVGCHSGDPRGPWPFTSYEHAASWANEIRAQMSKCTMPPVDAGVAMPTEEREKLLLWVRCGAPN